MIRSGHLLFRWRSYLPLLFVAPAFLALKQGAEWQNLVGDDFQDIWVLIALGVSLAGLGIRVATVGFVPKATSGRNATGQRADSLNTTGMYSIVRNPIYLGNFIILLGVFLSVKVLWFALVGSMVFMVYMERIVLAEEQFLSDKFGAVYNEWRARTPVIIPDFKLWIKPSLPFSLRTVLKREYPALMAIALVYLVNEMVTDLWFEGDPLAMWVRHDFVFPAFFVFCVTAGLILRFLKKKTKILQVEGR